MQENNRDAKSSSD